MVSFYKPTNEFLPENVWLRFPFGNVWFTIWSSEYYNFCFCDVYQVRCWLKFFARCARFFSSISQLSYLVEQVSNVWHTDTQKTFVTGASQLNKNARQKMSFGICIGELNVVSSVTADLLLFHIFILFL